MKLLYLLLPLCTFTSTFAETTKTIHVFVALCDNEHQGIVKVPAQLGNGKDPAKNLYWGALYGVKTFFKKDADWEMLKVYTNPEKHVLERCIFRHKATCTYLVADAYDGEQIKSCVNDFLESTAGSRKKSVLLDKATILTGGHASLICFVGHNGLMDFTLDSYPTGNSAEQKEAIILACASRYQFAAPLQSAGAHPLLWTSNLMSPEAYTLEAAITGWLLNESDEQIHARAAQAYHQYQKCGLKGAQRLLVTGY